MARSTGQTAAQARAEAQAKAAANRGARTEALARHFEGEDAGRGIIRLAQLSTAVFTVVTVVATIVNTEGIRKAIAIFDLVLFGVGCVLFLVAVYGGAQRSRDADMTMAGWWFLTGSAPRVVQATLLGTLGVQIVVGVVPAIVRSGVEPGDWPLAFGVLVPTLGLALCGLWGARYGMFPDRRPAKQ